MRKAFVDFGDGHRPSGGPCSCARQTMNCQVRIEARASGDAKLVLPQSAASGLQKKRPLVLSSGSLHVDHPAL